MVMALKSGAMKSLAWELRDVRAARVLGKVCKHDRTLIVVESTRRASPPAPAEGVRRARPGRYGAGPVVAAAVLTACGGGEMPGPPARVDLFPAQGVLGPDEDSLVITAVVEDSEGRRVPDAPLLFDHAGGELDGTSARCTDSSGIAEVRFHASADAIVCATVFPRPGGANTPECVMPPQPIYQMQVTGDCTGAGADDAGAPDGVDGGAPAGFASVFIQVQRPVICTVLPKSVSWTAGQALSLWIGGAGFAARPTVFVGNQQATVTSPGANGLEVVIAQPAAPPAGMQSIVVSNPASGYTYVWSSPGLSYLP